MREGCSPSWFNPTEVAIVREYVKVRQYVQGAAVRCLVVSVCRRVHSPCRSPLSSRERLGRPRRREAGHPRRLLGRVDLPHLPTATCPPPSPPPHEPSKIRFYV
jgi:hypothetical protein